MFSQIGHCTLNADTTSKGMDERIFLDNLRRIELIGAFSKEKFFQLQRLVICGRILGKEDCQRSTPFNFEKKYIL